MVANVNFAETLPQTPIYRELVYPHLCSTGMPVHKTTVMPVVHLFDNEYWDKLQTLNVNLIVEIDSLALFLNRSQFRYYIQRIASIKPKCLSFGNLYHPCLLAKMPIDLLDEELYYRTNMAHTILKNDTPKTVLISPAITMSQFGQFKNNYLDYLMHHRKLFDCYGIKYTGVLSEPDIGNITSIVATVNNFAPKEIWFTDFKIASCSHTIVSSSFIGEMPKPPGQALASARMTNLFTGLRRLNKKICLFYTGIYKDDYAEIGVVPSEWPPEPDEIRGQWSHRHFCGLVDHNQEFKSIILKTLVSIAEQNVYTSQFAV